MTQRSGFSDPSSYFYVSPPTVEIYPSATAMDSALVFGSFDPSLTLQVEDHTTTGFEDVNTRLILNAGKFVYPAILQSGDNDVSFRCKDISGNLSASSTVTIAKVKKTTARTRVASFELNGVAINEKFVVAGPDVQHNNKDGIMQMSFTLQGNGRPVLKFGDIIKYTLNDGITTSEFSASVITGKTTIQSDGERSQEILAQSTTDTLPRLNYTGTLRGTYNGDILRRLCNEAGYSDDNLYIPRGEVYVGPRSIDRQQVYDTIINPMTFIESWQIHQISQTQLAFLPSYVMRFVSWTFNDDQILSLGEEFDGSFRFNRARLVYEPIEDDPNYNAIAEDLLPDATEETTGRLFFASDDTYGTEITQADPDSVLFFAAVGSDSRKTDSRGRPFQLDWENITKASLIIKFNNTGGEAKRNTGGSLLSYHVDMDVFPSKKIAVGYFDIRPNHLLDSIPVYYQWMIADSSGNYIGNTPSFSTLRLKGESPTNFAEIVNQYGVEMSTVEELAVVEHSWLKISTPEDGPSQDDDGIFYARYDAVNDRVTYDYFVDVEVDDAVWSTIYFDIENATRNVNDQVHLLNAEIITADNQLINGNKYIYGVKAHEPNVPVRRSDRLLFKFRSTVDLGDSISLKFRVYGRRFISAKDDYEDYTNINVEFTNSKDVSSRRAAGLYPAVLDGGVILSGFVSTRQQATEKIRRVVTASSDDIVRESLQVQAFSEMREGQIVRVFSNEAGTTYNTYYLITKCQPRGDFNILEAVRTRKVIVNTTTGYAEPFAVDSRFDLTDLIEKIADKFTQFQFGTVQAQKYRGMFRVRLDNGIEVKHVISRVQPVNAEDRVAVVQTAAGSYVIIEVVRPSMTSNEYEDILSPDTETAEGWFDDIKDAETAGTTDTETTEGLTRKGSPLANYITIERIVPKAIKDGLIQYRDGYFDVFLSHDMDASLTQDRLPRTFKVWRQNFTNFCYVYDKSKNRYIVIHVEKIDTKHFRITPQEDLSFDSDINVGMAPISSTHPVYSFFRQNEIKALSLKEGATLEQVWQEIYKVQPKLDGAVTDVSQWWVDVQFNQAMAEDSILKINNWFCDTVGGV